MKKTESVSIYEIMDNRELMDLFKEFLSRYNISEIRKMQFINDYNNIIKEYMEKANSFTNLDEFEAKYGDYFANKLGYLATQIMKEGKDKDNSYSRSSSDRVDTFDNNDNQLDREEDDLDISDSLSGSIAMKYFDDHIEEQEKVVDDLRVAVNEAKLNSRKLIKELKKQEAILEILKVQSNTLSKSDSYGDNKRIAKNDDKLVDINNRLRDKLASLKIIEGINNRHVNRERLKLQRQIARLKKKQGKIMTKQSKVTNKKLISDYKRMVYTGNKIGKDEAIEVIRENRDSKLDKVFSNLDEKNENYNKKMDNAIDDGKFIKGKLYRVPVNISQAKLNLLDKYCKLLSFKDGKVDGFRKLPDNIKECIRNKVSNYDLAYASVKTR